MNRSLFAFIAIPVILFYCTSADLFGEDWPQWRGAARDGVSAETGLLDAWPESGPPQVWKANGLGGGYSSPAIVDGKIFGSGYRDGEEVVWVLSAEDGKEVWSAAVAKVSYDNIDEKYAVGPRATPTVDGEMLYFLGATGELACLETASGKMVWKHNLAADFGGELMSEWGFSEAPLIDGEHLICTPGGAQGTVAALDKNSGELIWQSKDLQDPAAYSSVVAAEIAGKKQYVVLTGLSVAGIDPDNGGVLWKIERVGKTAVVPTPIVSENQVWVTSGYGVGTHMFEISESGGEFSVAAVYDSTDIKNEFGGAVKVGDHVFASSGARFVCLNFKTGEDVWKARSAGSGGLLFADGHLYLRNDRGTVALIEVNADEYVEKGRFEQTEKSEEKTFPTPVIANGRLYLRDQDFLLCYDIAKK